MVFFSRSNQRESCFHVPEHSRSPVIPAQCPSPDFTYFNGHTNSATVLHLQQPNKLCESTLSLRSESESPAIQALYFCTSSDPYRPSYFAQTLPHIASTRLNLNILPAISLPPLVLTSRTHTLHPISNAHTLRPHVNPSRPSPTPCYTIRSPQFYPRNTPHTSLKLRLYNRLQAQSPAYIHIYLPECSPLSKSLPKYGSLNPEILFLPVARLGRDSKEPWSTSLKVQFDGGP